MKEILLPLRLFRAEFFVTCHGLAEARGNTVQNDVDEVMVSYLGVDIASIDIVQLFLHSTCLFEITDLVKSPVRLVMVTIVFPNGILKLFPSIEPMLVGLPPFQCLSFCT